MTTARYDGQTGWYESYAGTEAFAGARDFVVDLLGPGPGRCLDLGCGTGRAIPPLVRAGWEVVGVDVSTDQLDAARAHVGDMAQLVRADAHSLPFADAEFDAVVSILTHTDFDDVPGVLAEAGRALRTGGAFVHLGVHPCFASPFVVRGEGPGATLQPGYRRAGWQRLPPDAGSEKVRVRVGINHLPLAALLNAVIGSGFTITQVDEPGDTDPPLFLALRAVKRAPEPRQSSP